MPPDLGPRRTDLSEGDVGRTAERCSTLSRMGISDVGRRALVMIALAAMAFGLGACSSGGETSELAGRPAGTSPSGPPSLPKEQVAQSIAEKLAAQVGQQPKKVECPGDLPARQGASITCVLTANDDSTVGVTAVVTSVGNPNDLGSVRYDITADTTVTPAPPR